MKRAPSCQIKERVRSTTDELKTIEAAGITINPDNQK